jgi:hypothetical protein
MAAVGEVRAPVTVTIVVDSNDPELQVIEGILQLIKRLADDGTRARVVGYVGERVQADIKTSVTQW